jgi:hypothetical protein
MLTPGSLEAISDGFPGPGCPSRSLVSSKIRGIWVENFGYCDKFLFVYLT